MLMVLFLVHLLGKRRAGPHAAAVARSLAEARALQETAWAKAEARHRHDTERIQTEFDRTTRELDALWQQTLEEVANMRENRPRAVEEKHERIRARQVQRLAEATKRIERLQLEAVEQRHETARAARTQLERKRDAALARIQAEHASRWQTLEAEWRAVLDPILGRVAEVNAFAAVEFPDWQDTAWADWHPPAAFQNAAKLGRLEVDAPPDAPQKLPRPGTVSLPLLLTYPGEGSVLIETTDTGQEEAVAVINNLIFRLLAATPPGKLSLTLLDPVGLGHHFAALMHLADYEEGQISTRIWTQSTQIEERLAELNEQMEKVIQMYLRNEYATIADYNAQAGTVAEKYHLLVIAGFPVNFSETAARRLLHIATSGARCGVFTMIHWDRRHALPHDFVPDELRRNSTCLTHVGTGFALTQPRPPQGRLVLDLPPDPDFATPFLHRIGQASKVSSRVEVPFSDVTPGESRLWTGDTTEEVRVPIGRSGATKLQHLALGRGTRQHALIAGKTGSGKSNLFHVLITNLALWCSPEEIEFYLVDFKKGVEFKCYATRRLPHARVVAIESDREFGLSVLQRVDEELRRRGDLFRQLGVQDLAGYRRAGGSDQLPRSLLLIDEFQEFFVEEDRVSQNAAVLLDRLVRQGRAFGIHVLLGSQTLGGAYTLARATLGQMVVRIALQCNEADAYLIMDDGNAAPRLLSRPGEGIYNDAAGALEGNSPFQVVWLPEEVRDSWLARVRSRADRHARAYPGPMVFEGNAPAEVSENRALHAAIHSTPAAAPAAARIWLGAPNSIKDPTSALFRRQNGSHLLIVGQREESALSLFSLALIALAAQHPPETARCILLDASPPGSPAGQSLERVRRILPHDLLATKPVDVDSVLRELGDELHRRETEANATPAPAIYLFVHGLQQFRKLRAEDDFGLGLGDSGSAATPSAIFLKLLSEGASHGIHVLATCDTYANVSRFLGRKATGDFEMRVLFQMSAADSASLIDAPNASTLGLHRAILYNEREGLIETFRPYAFPGNDWLDRAGRALGTTHPSPEIS
jgi:hypothetical protein